MGCVHNPGAMFGWVLQDGAFASETRGEGWTGDSTYTSVNHAGTLVGWYRSRSANRILSFLTIGTGRTDFEHPGASRTQAWGLNADGDIVGWFGPAASSRGFLLREGQFTQIHVPDAVWTRAFGINADGDIVGAYRDGTGITASCCPRSDVRRSGSIGWGLWTSGRTESALTNTYRASSQCCRSPGEESTRLCT